MSPPSIPIHLKRWVPLCLECGDLTDVDGTLLLAIMERESFGGDALTPPGPTGTGDHGHGRGLMQIDDRFHSDFIGRLMPDGTPMWQNPRENILYAGRLLRGLISRAKSEGVGVAAYNSGKAIQVANALGPDATEEQRFAVANAVTRHGNYASEVLLNRAKFKKVLFSLEATP